MEILGEEDHRKDGRTKYHQTEVSHYRRSRTSPLTGTNGDERWRLAWIGEQGVDTIYAIKSIKSSQISGFQAHICKLYQTPGFTVSRQGWD